VEVLSWSVVLGFVALVSCPRRLLRSLGPWLPRCRRLAGSSSSVVRGVGMRSFVPRRRPPSSFLLRPGVSGWAVGVSCAVRWRACGSSPVVGLALGSSGSSLARARGALFRRPVGAPVRLRLVRGRRWRWRWVSACRLWCSGVLRVVRFFPGGLVVLGCVLVLACGLGVGGGCRPPRSPFFGGAHRGDRSAHLRHRGSRRWALFYITRGEAALSPAKAASPFCRSPLGTHQLAISPVRRWGCPQLRGDEAGAGDRGTVARAGPGRRCHQAVWGRYRRPAGLPASPNEGFGNTDPSPASSPRPQRPPGCLARCAPRHTPQVTAPCLRVGFLRAV